MSNTNRVFKFSKILFLDIDGVLNSYGSAEFYHHFGPFLGKEINLDLPVFRYHGDLCPIAVALLENLCHKVPDMKIVVSSVHRYNKTPEELRAIFHPLEISKRIIGKTPDIDLHQRGAEIKAWLDQFPTEQYAILDDEDDMGPVKDALIQTSAETGLTFKDTMRVIKLYESGTTRIYGEDQVI